MRRGAAFCIVGAVGLVVQLLVLWLLAGRVGMHYLPASSIAVEAAVLHNFAWHARWTWADRPADGRFQQLLRFNATNGAVSLGGNVVLMPVLVSGAGLHYAAASILSVAACALANYLASDWIVFKKRLRPREPESVETRRRASA